MNNFLKRLFTGLILIVAGYALFITLSRAWFTLLLGFIVAYILVVEWPRFKLWWLTPLYPVLPFLALIHLYLQDPLLWAWLVVVVAAYDIGGYIFGNLFGSIKIAPRISPGKTVQGLIGGVVLAGFVGILSASFLLKTYSFGILTLYLVSCSVGFLGFLGDFFESYLKRLSGLKDSGFILPGHGGILDRTDGLLCAALVFDSVLIFIK